MLGVHEHSRKGLNPYEYAATEGSSTEDFFGELPPRSPLGWWQTYIDEHCRHIWGLVKDKEYIALYILEEFTFLFDSLF